jgi:hypothetical protein
MLPSSSMRSTTDFAFCRSIVSAPAPSCLTRFGPGVVQEGRNSFTGAVSSYAAFLPGTFAPFLRASERPIAIACFRLLTVPPFPPRPDFSVPFFFRCIALFTLLPAAFPYFRLLADFRCAMIDLPRDT